MRFPVRGFALLALALPGPGCSGCGAPPAPSNPGVVFAAPAKDLPIANAAKITDGLYRGAQPDAAGLKALKEHGIRTVVNLRSAHSERKEAEALGLAVVEIPMVAALESRPPTEEEVKRFFEVVLDPARGPVFFQCAAGKDRTGTMAALYRIEVDGWSNEDAIREMRQFGFHEYYGDLLRFVRDYRPRGLRPPGR